MERIVEFKIGSAPNYFVLPSAPVESGVAGDHHVTRVVFTLSSDFGSLSGYHYRFEFVDGMGQYDTVQPVAFSGQQPSILIPSAWSCLGGVGEIRLVICKLDSDFREVETLYTFAGRLRFSGRSTGTGAGENWMKRGLSGLIAETKGAVTDAEGAVAAARDAASRLAEMELRVDNAVVSADGAASRARIAADNADNAAEAAIESVREVIEAADSRYSNALTSRLAGNPVIFDSADVSPLGGIRRIAVVGNSIQSGTPSPDVPVPIEGAAPSMITVNGTQYPTPIPRWLYGDVNMDGVVDAADVEYMVQYLAQHTGYALNDMQKILADVNGDGQVGTADKIMLDRYLAGWTEGIGNVGQPSPLPVALYGNDTLRDEFNLVSGVETRNWEAVQGQNATWTVFESALTEVQRFRFYPTIPLPALPTDGSALTAKCTHLSWTNSLNTERPYIRVSGRILYIALPFSVLNVNINDTDAVKLAALNAWFTAQANMGQPVIFVYPRETLTVQHEPVAIVSDAAEYNISADDGVLEVKYNRDINKAIAQLQNAILNLGGNL